MQVIALSFRQVLCILVRSGRAPCRYILIGSVFVKQKHGLAIRAVRMHCSVWMKPHVRAY